MIWQKTRNAMSIPRIGRLDQPASTLCLATLLSPLGVENFFHTYWEKAYLHIARNAVSYYDNMLTVRDLDDYFQRQNLHPSFIKVLKCGVQYGLEKWTTLQQRRQTEPYRVIAVEELLTLYNEGATIVINAAETAFPALAGWCSALGYEFKCRLQANIYITPPQARGGLPHYDTHDVLVLQISGHKQWRIYDMPEKWPITAQLLPAEAYASRPPAQQYELQAGDLLYLPRGLVHDACTTDSASIHVTLGIQSGYWFHLLEELATLAQDDPVFRQSLPYGLSSNADKTAFVEQFIQRLRAFVADVDLAALLERRYAAFVSHQVVDGRARFTDVLYVEQLTLDTLVSRRPHLHYLVEHGAQRVELTFGQTTLTMPGFMSPVLESFLRDQPFAVRAVKGLISDGGKLELVKRFVRAGFLTIVSSKVS